MCWNQEVNWDGPNGHDHITHFVEKFCAFCIAYPYDGSDFFPEAIAHSNAAAGPEITNVIRGEDISAAKRLGARTRNEAWAALQAHHGMLAALEELNAHWDLFQVGDGDWNHVSEAVTNALGAAFAVNGVKVANGTKLLWIKRPRLVPICDTRVVQRLTGNDHAELVDVAMASIQLIRTMGQNHLALLQNARDHATARLHEGNPYRNLFEVRILEAVLWFDTQQRGNHWPLLGWNG